MDGNGNFHASKFHGTATNSDALHGYSASTGADYNTIVRRTENGYIFGSRFNQNSANNENPTISQVMVTNGSDNYLRKTNLSNFKKNLCNGNSLSYSSNNSTSAGYVKLFNITVTSDYANAPMKFYISRRYNPIVELEMLFTNSAKSSTDFSYINYHTNNGGAITMYYLKVSDGSWDIYVFTNIPYDFIELMSYDIPQYMSNKVAINLTSSFTTSAPSGLVQITPKSYANIASSANSLSTARSITIGKQSQSFDGSKT